MADSKVIGAKRKRPDTNALGMPNEGESALVYRTPPLIVSYNFHIGLTEPQAQLKRQELGLQPHEQLPLPFRYPIEAKTLEQFSLDETLNAVLDRIVVQNGLNPRMVDLVFIKLGKENTPGQPAKVFHRRLKNNGLLYRSGEQQPSTTLTLRQELGQDVEEALTNTWMIVGGFPDGQH